MPLHNNDTPPSQLAHTHYTAPSHHLHINALALLPTFPHNLNHCLTYMPLLQTTSFSHFSPMQNSTESPAASHSHGTALHNTSGNALCPLSLAYTVTNTPILPISLALRYLNYNNASDTRSPYNSFTTWPACISAPTSASSTQPHVLYISLLPIY